MRVPPRPWNVRIACWRVTTFRSRAARPVPARGAMSGRLAHLRCGSGVSFWSWVAAGRVHSWFAWKAR